MELELERIDPIRSANILALVNGIVTCVFTLLFLPFACIAIFASPDADGAVAGGLFAFLVLLYPLIAAVFGWIAGFFWAAVYNLFARWIGGFRLTFRRVPGPGESAAGVPAGAGAAAP